MYSSFRDNIWGADLANMQLLSKYNKGYKFLLCIIDIYSKYAWVFFVVFFLLGFFSRTFTIHGTAGEGGGYLFNSSLPLPPTSQTLRH